MRQARRELVKAEAAARRHEDFDQRRGAAGVAHRHLRAVTKWEGIQSAYRSHLEALSLTVHPFAIGDAMPQSTSDVAPRLQAELEAFEMVVQQHQLPSKPEVIKKVRDQTPALIDCWWQGGARDLAQLVLTPPWRRWVKEALLPWAYWQCQVDRTRRPGRKAKMREVLEQVKEKFVQHPMTRRLSANVLADWCKWATEQAKAFQREVDPTPDTTSSAVEGRNGYLSQMHHHHRGLPKRRYQAWRALHNVDCRDADGQTPASRFFRREYPDFFEAVLSQMGELPRPRQWKRDRPISQVKLRAVPA